MVFAPRASEPDDGSVRQYAAIFSPAASRGKYFCFCSSVPKKTIGNVPIPTCAPKDNANAEAFVSFSLIKVVLTLSNPIPPYASGISALSSAGSPALGSSPAVEL
ncbi:hypothetical protein D3C81_1339410 [compost metagenome]